MKDVMFIDNEKYYRVLNGTTYVYKTLPDEYKPYFESLYKENEQLKRNWNKLKQYMIDTEQIYKENDDKYVKDMREMGIRHAYRIILMKMQELEQGSDSNE